MEDYEIEIDDSTFKLLSAIAKADDDAASLAAIAQVEPKEFRKFLRQSGEAENKYALQLLKAAESQLLALNKQKSKALSKARVKVEIQALAAAEGPAKTRDRIKVNHIRVTRKRPESMTRQITEQLTRLIESGAMTVGSYLPSERELANSLKVARNVVRGSYENLMKAGRIQSEGRKGRTVGRTKGALKKSKSGPQKSATGSRKSKKTVKREPRQAASKGAVRRQGRATTRTRSNVKRSASADKAARTSRK